MPVSTSLSSVIRIDADGARIERGDMDLFSGAALVVAAVGVAQGAGLGSISSHFSLNDSL